MAKSKLIRMDNIGIVVEFLDKAIAFFAELGLKLEGRTIIEGEWAGRSPQCPGKCPWLFAGYVHCERHR